MEKPAVVAPTLVPYATEPELRGPTPRRVRPTRAASSARRALWNAALAVAALLYFSADRDLSALRTLAARGRTVEARIEAREIRPGKNADYRLLYSYRAHGRSLHHAATVTAAEYEAAREGGTLPITFLPDDPETHGRGGVNAASVREQAGVWAAVWTAFGFVALGVLGVYEMRRGERRRLLLRGVPVEAVVTGRDALKPGEFYPTTYLLAYTATVSVAGRGAVERSGRVTVPRAVYEAHPPGASFTLLRPPDDPTALTPYGVLARTFGVEAAPPRAW